LLEIKVGVALASLGQPFKTAIRTAARLGVRAVEIDARNDLRPSEFSQTGIRDLRKMLKDYELSVSAVSFPTRRGYGDIRELERRIEATKQAMKFAYDLGCSVVVNQVGQIPEDKNDPSWKSLVQALTDIGNAGQRYGAFLCARTGTEEGERMKELIDALPIGSLAVDFDPGALIVNGFSASEAIDHLANKVAHFHVRDGVTDLARGRGIEVPVGRGSVDFPQLFGKLEEQGYSGWFTIQRDEGADRLGDIANTIEFLKNL
jgi:sugar phosphate isomerase/epimerase